MMMTLVLGIVVDEDDASDAAILVDGDEIKACLVLVDVVVVVLLLHCLFVCQFVIRMTAGPLRRRPRSGAPIFNILPKGEKETNKFVLVEISSNRLLSCYSSVTR